jgi:predicted Ser/Thr protein kinase/tetratricopeptide (TPR) repeat protein
MQKFGRYEILEEIGRGGFGRVFRANDPVMKREVAIKVMATSEDPGMLTRFRNEAASAGHLRHENIVTVYDFGEEQGVPYIVMEFLQGRDLQQIQERGISLSLLEKVRILCEVAAGLEAAHTAGVIHRDVKPANVMILKDGSVKIMDFGIARLSEEDGTRVTRTGMLMGTLQYIPPEQFEGQPADALTDLWGFGVIAFQLLAGRNPFDGGDTANVIYRITTQRVPDIRTVATGIPDDIAEVVGKLLQRERAARFPSFEDVLIDLKPIEERLERVEAARLVDQARVMAAQGELATAHQLVRQVLERYPSNPQARQIRDQIVAQIRTQEAKQQVEDLLRKGDQELAQSHYDEAATIYAQACRVSPKNTTARLRLERANDMAERVRRTRAELAEARARLEAGAARDAQTIVTVVLAGDPDNVEAEALMEEISEAIVKQDEAARTDAILRARMLASNDQYEQAISLLRATLVQVGDHPDLRKAEDEIRQAAAVKAEQNRIDEQISAANDRVRRGLYTEAKDLLAPLAHQYPDHEAIRDTMARAEAEKKRTEAKEASEMGKLKALQAKTVPPAPPASPVVMPPSPPPPPPSTAPIPGLNKTVVISRALEIAREHELRNDPEEAVRVLDVALSGYGENPDLAAERRRLAAKAAAKTQPVVVPPPPPAPPPPAPAAQREPSDIRPPEPSGSQDPAARTGVSISYWVAVAAIGCLIGAGVYIWQTRQTPPTASEVTPTVPQATPAPPPKAENTVPETKPPVEAPKETPKTELAKETPKKEITRKETPKKVDAAKQPPPFSPPQPQPQAAAELERPKPAGPPPLANTPANPAPWMGRRTGTAIWAGSLEPGARLVLGSNGVQEGDGVLNVQGGNLPTQDMDVTGLVPELSHQVFPATRLQRVVIVNNTSTPVKSLRFNWAVK